MIREVFAAAEFANTKLNPSCLVTSFFKLATARAAVKFGQIDCWRKLRTSAL